MNNIPEIHSRTMNLNVKNDVPFLTYKALEKIPFINHAFSTRLGGVSTGEFTSMNLACASKITGVPSSVPSSNGTSMIPT